MARHFTLEQAEELLPVVKDLLQHAVTAKDRLTEITTEMESQAHRVAMVGGANIDRREFLVRRARQEKHAKRLKELIQQIHSLGVQVKDLDAGLLDFPTLYRGSEVYLCWKLGEKAIAFWHPVEEGFRGRRPIDSEFLDNHKGDEPH